MQERENIYSPIRRLMCVPSLKACEPTETELGFTTLPEEPELLRGNTQHSSLSAVCHVLWWKKNLSSIQGQGK